MSLLMQALRKAERARAQSGHDTEYGDDLGQAPFGADAVPSPPPIEGGPAFAVMPDSWRLEPLDAEPPVVAAQEAAHDPVPPQARHEPVRPPSAPSTPRMPPAADMSDAPRTTRATGHAPDSAGVNASGGPGAPRRQGLPRAIASSQRRLAILAGTLAALLAVFAFIYWRAVSAPGPGAQLPKVPMPTPGSPPAVLAGSQQGAPIPVTPYVTPLGADPGLQAGAPAGAAATAEAAGTMAGGAAGAPGLIGAGPVESGVAAPASPPSTAAKAPPTRPDTDVTIPTPEQLAAITDPAIRAEAMRDAAERAARQVRAEGSAAPAPATVHEGPATQSQTSEPVRTHRPEPPLRRQGDTAAHKEAGATLKTAIGDAGNVQFVRGTAPAQVAPAVQNGYAALKSGDLATAHQQYDLALLQDPNNRDALLGAAAVALREHDGRQASSNYLRLLELDPNDPEALAGLAELRPGDLQENEIKLRGLARQHPGSGPVQFALGNLFARQGRWPEAQQSYFRAFNAMPENADYAFNLGVGLDRMNQPRLAQTYYRRALELAQASPPSFNIDAVRKRLQVLETPPQ